MLRCGWVLPDGDDADVVGAHERGEDDDAGPGVVEGRGALAVMAVDLVGTQGEPHGAQQECQHGTDGQVAVVRPEGEVGDRADAGHDVDDHDGDRVRNGVDGEQEQAVDDQEDRQADDPERTDGQAVGVDVEDVHGKFPSGSCLTTKVREWLYYRNTRDSAASSIR